MSQIQLRPYQKKFIDDVRNEFAQGYKRVVGVAPCGAGKTIMTGWMIRESVKRGKRSIFFVHRSELIRQTAETFIRLGIEHGIIDSETPMQLDLPVQIASVQTLARRIDKIPAPDFLVCDECHHILAETYKKIIDRWSNAYLLGVTATPLRMGGKTLSDVFTSMVLAPSVNQLINLGNLTKFNYFAAPIKGVNLDGVRITKGDFNSNDLDKIMSRKEITGNIVDNYKKFAEGKSAICYCVNVNHSKQVAQAFNDAGIYAAHVDGNTPAKERELIVENFRKGNITVLCNAELFGEGFDVPRCQAVILARPTNSLTLFIQQTMRSMRPDKDDPNKVAVIIDCVQNRERHGLPNDFHEWSIDPNIVKRIECPHCHKLIVPKIFTKRTTETPLRVKAKERRFFLKDSFDRDGEPVKLRIDYDDWSEPYQVVEDNRDGKHLKICPDCGLLFIPKDAQSNAPPQPKHRDGELKQIEISFKDDTDDTATIIHKGTHLEALLKIAQKKGYKKGWVAYHSLEFATSYEDCLIIAETCGYKKGWAWHKWNELSSK